MRSHIFVLLIVFLSFFPISAQARQGMVSPKPGEGPVQMAERFGIDPSKFIKLNRELGIFVDPRRPSLIYTWQKFVLPGSITEKRYCEMQGFIQKGKEAQTNTLNREKSEMLSRSKFETLKSELEKKEKELSKMTLLIGILMGLMCIFLVVVLMIPHKRKSTGGFHSGKQFFVVFSKKLSSYGILPENESSTELSMKNSIDELVAVAVGLSLRQSRDDFSELFSFQMVPGRGGNNAWRNLNDNEKEAFIREYMKRMDKIIDENSS